MCKSCTNFVCVCEKVARRYSIGVLHHWSLKRYVDPPKIMPHWWCLLSRLSCLRFHIFWNPNSTKLTNSEPIKRSIHCETQQVNKHALTDQKYDSRPNKFWFWMSQSVDWTNCKAEVFNSWNWREIFSAELEYLVPRKTGTIWPLWLLHLFTYRKSSTEQQQPSFADLRCFIPKHTHSVIHWS